MHLAFVECASVYWQSPHGYSISSFATMNQLYFEDDPRMLVDPYPVDALIHTESMQTDFRMVLKDRYPRIGSVISERGAHERNSFKCKVPNVNSSNSQRHTKWKNETGFEREYFRVLLTGDASLMRRVCAIYIQDFICFGYELPDECKFPEYYFV